MRKKTIAFLYNVRHHYPDINDPRTQLEVDFDDPESINTITNHLRACGYNVISIEANEQAYFKLYENRKKIDLAFNYSEGIYGQDRECQIPAILEMLQIPHSGPSPLSSALTLNKAKAKEVLMSYGIATLPFQLFTSGKEKLDKKLKFPLIVKPVSQGSSAGITNESVVNDEKNLRRQLDTIIKRFSQPAIVEPFLTGREFSVPMLGNPPRILPLIEANHKDLPKEYIPLDSFEVKWYYEDHGGADHFICPARISQKLGKKIENICLGVWQSLNVCDWCRIDIRCDNKENPYFLELNIPPGIIPPEQSLTSYFPLSARIAGIDYQTMLKKIISSALTRYGIQ